MICFLGVKFGEQTLFSEPEFRDSELAKPVCGVGTWPLGAISSVGAIFPREPAAGFHSSPKVTQAFDGAISMSKPGSERKQAVLDMCGRHKNWVKRTSSAAAFATGRPAKKYRVSSKHFVQNVDNQATIGVLRGSTMKIRDWDLSH